MGFLFKSAIGLGCVYFAMFGQALRSGDPGPAASLCANALKANLAGGADLGAPLAAAGCAVALKAETRKIVAPAAPPAPAPPPKRHAGTLSADDLRDPWFGPGRISRKPSGRG